jgi:hypothetical protein
MIEYHVNPSTKRFIDLRGYRMTKEEILEMDKSTVKRKRPQYVKRMGKEKLRCNDHPATSPQLKALLRAQRHEAVKRTTTKKEEK